jgi:two-component sensor histidine kinase
MNREVKKQWILENLIYLIIWLVVFAMPLFKVNYPQTDTRDWPMIVEIWKTTFFFFLLFLLNNYVLVPYFLIRKKSWKYALFVILSLLAFSAIEPLGLRQRRALPPAERSAPPNRPRDERPPFRDERPPFRDERFRFPPEGREGIPAGPDRRFNFAPPFILLRLMINSWLIAILLLGFNIAIKFLFKSIRDDRHLRELEKHTLEVELNYLKAQINPHFFMNTLNNIHALIDINTEKAKETVIELSKIMRYVLYGANQTQVALSKEIQFIENYVALMRLRYTEEIDIRLQLPPEIPEAHIPPMLLMTLIENAFKHGVSYRHNSFVYITLSIEADALHCLVINRLIPSLTPRKPGMGLENMYKRLSLLYGDRYTLDTQATDEEYRVTLIIPLNHELHSDRR